MSGSSIKTAMKSGLKGGIMGASIGGVVGGYQGIKYANENGIDPWSGKYDKSIVLGRDMVGRVNPAANDLNAETISSDWHQKFGTLKILDKHGLEFNADWLQNKLDNNYNIYNFGKGGFQSNGAYYGLELKMIQNYQNVVPGNYIYNNFGIRVITF